MKIASFDLVTSTNDIIKDDKYAECIVIAKNQSNGKGRYANSFFCYEGGLYFSFRITNQQNIEAASMAMAIAIWLLFDDEYHIKLDIKWLNDLYYKKKKVAGILCEKVYLGKEFQYMIIGVGINLVKFDVPDELSDKARYLFEEFNIDYHDVAKKLVELFNCFLKRDDLMKIYKKISKIIGKYVYFDGKRALVRNISDTGLLEVLVNGEPEYLDCSNTKLEFKND
jgi:BirA family biotin operon repressor/biotin-[acetyl-CoA-carboxylase] ligase